MAIEFVPANDEVVVEVGVDTLLAVTVTAGYEAAVVFRRASLVVAEGQTFSYRSDDIVTETVTAAVTVAGQVTTHEWQLSAVDSRPLPPSVPVAEVLLTESPVTVRVRWNRPALDGVTDPIVEYLVAANLDGPVTDANWEAAVDLGAVAHETDRLFYEATFDDTDGLVGGRDTWFAVRARNEAGRLSTLDHVLAQHIRVSAATYIEGHIRSETKLPIPNAIVDYGCDTCKTTTDLDGFFRLGPFRDIDNYVLRTITPDNKNSLDDLNAFYDLETDSITVETPRPLTLTLIGRHDLGTSCGGTYGGSFLAYFRHMTYTDNYGLTGFQLWKWDSYPVRIHVPDGLSQNGIDMQARTLRAVELWNQAQDEDCLELVATPAEAQIAVAFAVLPTPLYGRTEVVEPAGAGLNTTIPERIEVRLAVQLNTDQAVTEIALHELGHALGLGNHSSCDEHIMHQSPLGTFDTTGEDGAVSAEERHALRCIRNLPQGARVDRYDSR